MRKKSSLACRCFFNIALALSLSLIFLLLQSKFLVSILTAPSILTGPQSYSLRWGEKEPASDDMVTMPPGDSKDRPRPSPGCYKVGTSGFSIEYSVGVNFNAFLIVTVTDLDKKVYWEKIYSDVPPKGKVSLGGFNLPDHIEILEFHVQWAQWQPAACFPVYVVLDAPKAPMDPAWVNLLNYSCRWGRGTSNLHDAAQAITFGVFFQRPGFAYPTDARTYWVVNGTFMLKALLDRWSAGVWTKGNCVDASCLTMLALCSVGLDFSVRQLTGTLLPPAPLCGRDGCSNFSSPHFHTNLICPIGSDPTQDWTYGWWSWAWHQICVQTGAPNPPSNAVGIWDPTAAQKEDLNGNGYRNPPAHHPSHLWPQKDYWQKPHTQVPGAWLGLVNEPVQGAGDPQLYGLGTWKCGVSANPYTPPP